MAAVAGAKKSTTWLRKVGGSAFGGGGDHHDVSCSSSPSGSCFFSSTIPIHSARERAVDFKVARNSKSAFNRLAYTLLFDAHTICAAQHGTFR